MCVRKIFPTSLFSCYFSFLQFLPSEIVEYHLYLTLHVCLMFFGSANISVYVCLQLSLFMPHSKAVCISAAVCIIAEQGLRWELLPQWRHTGHVPQLSD